MYKILPITFSLIFIACSAPSYNLKKALNTSDVKLNELSYVEKIHTEDKYLMKKAGIELKEKINLNSLNKNLTYNQMFKLLKKYLNQDFDIINAFEIAQYLNQKNDLDEYKFYLAKCYYYMGELYIEGYIKKYYEKAYSILKWLIKKEYSNTEYLKWASMAAAKIGAVIRHKEKSTFSGLDYLQESNSLNRSLLRDFNANDEDALLTEGEVQIETSSIPLFGGSKKEGLKIYKKVLKKNPKSVRANLLLGKYYYKETKNYEMAIKYLKKAIIDFNEKPLDMKNFYSRVFAEMHLVRIYGKLKDKDQQWEHLKNHLALLPRSPSGLKALLSYYKKDKNISCDIVNRLSKMDPLRNYQDKIEKFCIE